MPVFTQKRKSRFEMKNNLTIVAFLSFTINMSGAASAGNRVLLYHWTASNVSTPAEGNEENESR